MALDLAKPTIGGYDIIEPAGAVPDLWIAQSTNSPDQRVFVRVLNQANEPVLPSLLYRNRRVLRSLSGDDSGFVPLIDKGTDQDGRPFVAFRPFPIGSLADQLAHGPTDWPTAVELVAEAASVAGRAHEEAVSLGDIRPEWLWLENPKRVRIVPWGMATRHFDGGQPSYLSPEAQAHEILTPAADVWSLVMVLCALVLGRGRPSTDPLSGYLAEVEQVVPERVFEVVQSALSVDAPNRFGNGTMLAAALLGATRPRQDSVPLIPQRHEQSLANESPHSTKPTETASAETADEPSDEAGGSVTDTDTDTDVGEPSEPETDSDAVEPETDGKSEAEPEEAESDEEIETGISEETEAEAETAADTQPEPIDEAGPGTDTEPETSDETEADTEPETSDETEADTDIFADAVATTVLDLSSIDLDAPPDIDSGPTGDEAMPARSGETDAVDLEAEPVIDLSSLDEGQKEHDGAERSVGGAKDQFKANEIASSLADHDLDDAPTTVFSDPLPEATLTVEISAADLDVGLDEPATALPATEPEGYEPRSPAPPVPDTAPENPGLIDLSGLAETAGPTNKASGDPVVELDALDLTIARHPSSNDSWQNPLLNDDGSMPTTNISLTDIDHWTREKPSQSSWSERFVGMELFWYRTRRTLGSAFVLAALAAIAAVILVLLFQELRASSRAGTLGVAPEPTTAPTDPVFAPGDVPYITDVPRTNTTLRPRPPTTRRPATTRAPAATPAPTNPAAPQTPAPTAPPTAPAVPPTAPVAPPDTPAIPPADPGTQADE